MWWYFTGNRVFHARVYKISITVVFAEQMFGICSYFETIWSSHQTRAWYTGRASRRSVDIFSPVMTSGLVCKGHFCSGTTINYYFALQTYRSCLQNYAKHAEKQVYMTWSKMPEARSEARPTPLPLWKYWSRPIRVSLLWLSQKAIFCLYSSSLEIVMQSDVCEPTLPAGNDAHAGDFRSFQSEYLELRWTTKWKCLKKTRRPLTVFPQTKIWFLNKWIDCSCCEATCKGCRIAVVHIMGTHPKELRLSLRIKGSGVVLGSIAL